MNAAMHASMHTSMHTSALQQRGFTMIEAIVVIVITGIIGGIVAGFLRLPVQNYVDSAGRAELTDVADTAVRRMAREIRLALPNSVRVIGTDAIEFIPTKTGGRYLAAEDNAAGGDYLNFDSATDVSFRIVGPLHGGAQAIAPGDFIVVNNLGYDASDAYAAAASNRATVQSLDAANKLVTLASNPFAQQATRMAHPQHRFQVTGQPVTYRCAGGNLVRHSGYGFNAAQVAAPSANPPVLASNVQSCAFHYTAIGHTRTALVRLTLTLRRPTGQDGAIELMQQVHVDNTP